MNCFFKKMLVGGWFRRGTILALGLTLCSHSLPAAETPAPLSAADRARIETFLSAPWSWASTADRVVAERYLEDKTLSDHDAQQLQLLAKKAAAYEGLPRADVRQWLAEILERGGHSRQSGAEGNRRTAAWLEEHFRARGLQHVTREALDAGLDSQQIPPLTAASGRIAMDLQPLEEQEAQGQVLKAHKIKYIPADWYQPPALQTVVQKTTVPFRIITAAGAELSLSGLAGHGIYTPTCGSGIQAPLQLLSGKRLQDLDGLPIAGRICVMDLAEAVTLRDFARMMGAVGFIYYRGAVSPTYADLQALCLDDRLPAALADPQDVAQLQAWAHSGQEVLFEGRMALAEVPVWNVWGMVVPDGMDTNLQADVPTLVLTAFYDSYSLVPERSPGAQTAAGLVALLQSMEAVLDLKAQGKLENRVLFLATGGHFDRFSGMRAFAFRHARSAKALLATTSPSLANSQFLDLRRQWAQNWEQQNRIRMDLVIALHLTTGTGQCGLFGTDANLGTGNYGKQPLSMALGVRHRYLTSRFTARPTMIGKENVFLRSSLATGQPMPEDLITHEGTDQWQSYQRLGRQVGADSEILAFVGIPSVSIKTIQDYMPTCGTPWDALAQVDDLALAIQARAVEHTVLALAMDGSALLRDWEKDASLKPPADRWSFADWNAAGSAKDLTQSVCGDLVYWDYDKNPIVPTGRAGIQPIIPLLELEQFVRDWSRGGHDPRISSPAAEEEVLLLAEKIIANLAQQLSQMHQLNPSGERGAQLLELIAILAEHRAEKGWFVPQGPGRDLAFEEFLQRRMNQVLAIDRRLQRERSGLQLAYQTAQLGVIFTWPTPYNENEIIFTHPAILPRGQQGSAGTEWVDQFYYYMHPVQQQLYNSVTLYPFALDEAGNVCMGYSSQMRADFPNQFQMYWFPLHTVRVLVDYCRTLTLPGLIDPNTLARYGALVPQRPQGLPSTEAALPFGYYGTVPGKGVVCVPRRQVYEDPDTDRVAFISSGLKMVFSDASLQLANVQRAYLLNPPAPDAHEKAGQHFQEQYAGRGWDIDGPATEYLRQARAADDQQALALGEPAGSLRFIPQAPYQAAGDLWFLADMVLRRFHTLKIGVADILEKHATARDLILDGYRALDEYRYGAADRAFRVAHAIEAKNLKYLLKTQRGTMGGVVFYMLLILPFAIFMERLFIGAANIYYRLTGFAVMAIICIWVLAMVHPAFRATVSGSISVTSLLGIHAFAIMIAALWIILYIQGRFAHAMTLIRRQTQGHFESDIKRSQAFGAGITIGLSNLRRRPLRTGLTVLVISLLTFSILSFTSVTSRLGIYERNLPELAPYDGLLVHHEDWEQFEDVSLPFLREFWLAESPERIPGVRIAERVYGRFWHSYPQSFGVEETLAKVIRADNGCVATVGGFMGLSPEEPYALPAFSAALETFVADQIHTQRWFAAADEPAVLIPESLAQALKFSAEEISAGRAYVQFLGQPYQVLGTFDAWKISAIRDLDGYSPLPLDFSQLSHEIIELLAGMRSRAAGELDDERDEASPLTLAQRMDPAKLLIFPSTTALRLGGQIHSLAVVAPPDKEAQKQFAARARDFVGLLSFRCYLGLDGQAIALRSITETSMKRMGAMVIPLLVVGLIVLNTMMGAVAERMREISTYSSVGLAPAHIGVLFLSESAVFATVGAVNGYLLGQLAAYLTVHFNWMEGLQLNYSSTSAVISSVLVMLMVFLSTIWPARRASQMSVPDVTRSWNPTPPKEGHIWRFDFPFTVAGYDAQGMVGYVARYFRDAIEGALTEFFADHVQIRTTPGIASSPAYHLSARIWLAPFDLGVSQDVSLDFLPTGSFGVYEVQIALRLVSGELSSWVRLNKRFLTLLRKRFLLWRVVPQNIKQMNIELTQALAVMDQTSPMPDSLEPCKT